jgi:hypothetical protein
MNELQVKTINLTPAVVEFNFDELSAILDQQLKKYDGLTFTEKDAAACKKTIAELNKGNKALDTYRKETKKQLTASVTAFEDRCKELNKKFDDVINPLKEQHDQFENARKEVKRMQIQNVIDGLIEKENLNDKYSAQLIIPDEYFNKSKSLKSIQEELTTKAEHLGIQQDKEEADQEVIKSHVALINAKYGTKLPESAYVGLLAYKDVGPIKNLIESGAQKEIEKQKPSKEYKQVPQSSAPGHVDKKIFVEKYQVEGTEYDLEILEEYMSSKGLTWKVIEE